jgi:homocysteine S-methyltransferase
MITILDGGMGQELIARSAAQPTPLWATKVLMEEPELVRAVHDDFFAAGAKVATTNSYAIHHDRLIAAGLDEQFEPLHRAACEIACASRDAAGGRRVAGAIGPLIGSYQIGPLPTDAAERFAEVCRIQAPYVDHFLIETVSALDHVRATLAGATGHGKSVWLSVSVDDYDGTKLRSGVPLEHVMDCFDRAEALLVNCATPEAVTMAVDVIKGCGKPLVLTPTGSLKLPKALCRWVRPFKSCQRVRI